MRYQEPCNRSPKLKCHLETSGIDAISEIQVLLMAAIICYIILSRIIDLLVKHN